MLISDTNPTPYDLRFSLLGFPVRVHPSFWIGALILGTSGGASEPALAAVWVACVFVSVLVHELGHALTQRAFGGQARVTLYAFGGLSSAVGVRQSPWRNIVIALAGPIAGFAFAALVIAIDRTLGPFGNPLAERAVAYLLFANIAWGVLNLAPILPLDGGCVARELLGLLFGPAKGLRATLVLSIVVAAALAAWLFYATGSAWNTALLGLLGYENYRSLEALRASRRS
ncbi:MAG: site-2 protease family protein [Lacipirellulaceae bacterium]